MEETEVGNKANIDNERKITKKEREKTDYRKMNGKNENENKENKEIKTERKRK